MTSTPSYCGVCSRNLDEEILRDGEFMIQCDVCEVWYHGKCAELEEYEAADIESYHCHSCFAKAGPSQPKIVRNHHRYDYSDPDADNKPTENGTRRFVEELLRRSFLDASPITAVLENGHLLTFEYLRRTNFGQPIVVENMAGLGLIVPPPSFNADTVEAYVGGDRYVDVIDVYAQHSYKMRLKVFLSCFRQQQRPKLYNLISLEFSDTKLSQLIQLPEIVDGISWVEQYWPKPLRDDLSSAQKAVLNEHIAVKPEVSKFCLIGMAGSYTDFHIDFGGTSVFYHLLWGEKVFYLIEPTERNLWLFDTWQQSVDFSEKFFGDIVQQCFRLVLKPGKTLFIPTGWIHAVYTPEDSLVIGGNFLHSFNIGLQIRVYEMEKRAHTAEKFLFPHFELVNWYAGMHLLDTLKELNDEKTPAKPYLLNGVKALVAAMELWIQRNQSSAWPLAQTKNSKVTGQVIIETMTCSQVLKQLETAVRVNEKLASSSKGKGKRRAGTKRQKAPICKIDQAPDLNVETTEAPSANYALERSKGCPKSPSKLRTSLTTSSATLDAPVLDSAPPTPKWTEDTDEAGDKIEKSSQEDGANVAVDTPVDQSVQNTSQHGQAEKKVFGFSLLDMEANQSESIEYSQEQSGLETVPAPGGTSPSAPVIRPHPPVIPNERGRLTLSLRRNISKPITVSKSNQQHISGLGSDRGNEEFVYPSLSDSEMPDRGIKKRRKSSSKEAPKRAANVQAKPDSPGPSSKGKRQKSKTHLDTASKEPRSDQQAVPTAACTKPKKTQKGTTKQRLANKLKMRKLIVM